MNQLDRPPNVIVILVCGMPGCGKSTLVHAMVQACVTSDTTNERAMTLEHIEYDEIYREMRRNQTHRTEDVGLKTETEPFQQLVLEDSAGSEGRIAWQESRCVALQRVEQWLAVSNDHHDATRVLLLDDNFYLKSMRKQIHQVCAKFIQEPDSSPRRIHLFFGIIYLPAPLSVCRQRNAQRPTPVAAATMERLHERFEVPTVQNPWEAAILVIETRDHLADHVAQVLQFLAGIVENKAALVVPRAAPDESLPDPYTRQQQADLFWRRCVGWVAQQARSKVHLANRVRRHCLQLSLGDSSTRQWLFLFVQGIPHEGSEWLTGEEQQRLEHDMLGTE
jgi:tRNA uridine 5-carbamoylmethylation protein Kti12